MKVLPEKDAIPRRSLAPGGKNMKTACCKLPIAASLLLFIGTPLVQAQDLFLFDLSKKSNGVFALANGKNITKRAGYDNQPYFSAGGKSLVYTSNRGKETDIYEYELQTGKTAQLTNTPERPEFSPIPNADNTAFTVVTENTNPNQTVWRIDKATGQATWALASHEPVGYYVFNKRGEALLWLRYAYVVQFVHPAKNLSKFVVDRAAPSRPLLVPGTDNFSFVHWQGDGETWIKMFNPDDSSITPLAPTTVGTQIDYCWSADGVLLMGNGSKLFQWKPKQSTEWQEVADLAQSGVQDITRMIVSPDNTKIVIVGKDNLN